MNNDNSQRFYEGDVITFRDYEYEITRVDYLPVDDRVIQYRLEPQNDESPPATLEPAGDESAFVVKEFHQLDHDDVTVIE